MDEREIVYEQVGNYTKYALVEMLINKHKKSFNSFSCCWNEILFRVKRGV